MVVIPLSVVTSRRSNGRTNIEARLRAAGALSPERSVLMTPESDEVTGLDEAIGLGRVVRTASGRLYLNPSAIGAGGAEAVFALLLFLLVIISVLISVISLIVALKG